MVLLKQIFIMKNEDNIYTELKNFFLKNLLCIFAFSLDFMTIVT